MNLKKAFDFVGVYFLCSMFFIAEVSANDIIQDSITNILSRQQQIQDAKERRESVAPNIFVKPFLVDKKNIKKKKNEACINIHRVLVEGVTVLKAQVDRYVSSKLTGVCLSSSKLNIALADITNLYIEKGYITSRAYVIPQNLKAGILHIKVVEGKLSNFDFSKINRGKPKVKMAFPKRRGGLLNLRDLEQGLEQMNRLPSNKVTMSIVPGEEVGHSSVHLNNKRAKPWSLQFSADNHGNRSLGKIQNSLSLSVDNILAINDHVNFFINKNNQYSERKGGYGDGVNYSFPKGYWTFEVGLNRYEHGQIVKTPLSEFLTTGKNKTYYFQAKKIINRSQNSKSEINFKLSKNKVENYLEDTKINVSSYNTNVATLGYKRTKIISNGHIISEIKLHKGLSFFGADDDSSRIFDDEPEAQFFKVTSDLELSRQWLAGKIPVAYSGSLQLQLSNDNLYPTEQIGVGGLYSVRGYENYSESSNKGIRVRNELYTRKTLLNDKVSLSPYVSLDLGHVLDKSKQNNSLIGGSIGLRVAYTKLNLDISLNKALRTFDGLVSSKPFLLGKISINF